MATNQMRREAAKRKLANQQKRRTERAKRRQRAAIIASASAVVIAVVAVVLVSTIGMGGGEEQPTAAPGAPTSIPSEIAPLPVRPSPLPATVNCDYPASGVEAARPVQPPAGGDISATGTVPVSLQTSAGSIPLTLDRALAPCAVNSFVSLAQQGYFNETSCHRLTTGDTLQVLQCGDPRGDGGGGPGYTIPDEVLPELTYGRGMLAMAKTTAPNSGGSQFFMIYGNAQLPPEYTVFGSISPDGLQVLDAIAREGHDGSFEPSPGGGRPLQQVTIESANT